MSYIEIEFPTLEKVLNEDWYKSRPKLIQEAINKLPPTQYYKIKSTGHQCFLLTYGEPESQKIEDVEVTVQKTGKGGVMDGFLPPKLNQNGVFGLKLNDLEVWENT